MSGWLDDLLGYKDIYSSVGLLARRRALRFLDGTLTDNPTLGTTDINLLGTAHGALQPSDGIHGTVSWLYADATTRRASSHTSADLWHDAAQTDTTPPTIWKIIAVSGGVATWTRIDTGPDASAATPLTIFSGLYAWWRPDLSLTNVPGVSNWVDQKSGIALANTVGAQRPTLTAADATLNNLPTVGFASASSNFLQGGSVVLPASYWRIFIVKATAWALNKTLVATAGNSARILQGATTPQINLGDGPVYNANLPVGTWRLLLDQQHNTTADGLTIGATAAGGTALGRTASSADMFVGCSYAGGNWGDYQIAEILIGTGVLPGSELTAYNAYASSHFATASLFA